MQKYILGCEPPEGCALICPFDDNGGSGEWRKFNAGIVYLADDVDARIAELERALDSCQLVLALELREREKFKVAAHAEAAKAHMKNSKGDCVSWCPACSSAGKEV